MITVINWKLKVRKKVLTVVLIAGVKVPVVAVTFLCTQ